MAVFRVERTRDYTVMSNHHLKNKDLSLKAKGLLSQMLSLPEKWDYTLAGLSAINRESKDAIRSAVNELEKATSTSSMNSRSRYRLLRRRVFRQREIRQRKNRRRKIQRN